jgi:hypothetical protein
MRAGAVNIALVAGPGLRYYFYRGESGLLHSAHFIRGKGHFTGWLRPLGAKQSALRRLSNLPQTIALQGTE